MKILHTVQLYDPAVGGSEEVVKQISERLVRRGHVVTVATAALTAREKNSINGVRIEEFHIAGNMSLGMRGETERYRRFILQFKPDVMMNYASIIWTTDLVLPLLQDIAAKKVFVPCGYLLNDQRYQAYYQQLPAYLAQYDALVYMSANYQDKTFGDHHGFQGKGIIIPNAASAEEFLEPPLGFRKRYGITTKFMLLCVANHYPTKGHAFVMKAFRLLKRRDVTLVIIGNPTDGLRSNCYWRCLAKSWVRRSLKIFSRVPRPWVVSAFQEADLFVFGSHIECAPLVIIEAMAARLPFVSTDCGNVRDYQKFGTVVKTHQTMADAVKRYLDNRSERIETGLAGFSAWQKHHTWESIAERYECLYTNLIKGQSRLVDEES